MYTKQSNWILDDWLHSPDKWWSERKLLLEFINTSDVVQYHYTGMKIYLNAQLNIQIKTCKEFTEANDSKKSCHLQELWKFFPFDIFRMYFIPDITASAKLNWS